MRQKVAEMVKAVENPHTAYANYLSIHTHRPLGGLPEKES